MVQRSTSHLEHQPFNQVPWLTDGELTVFESGAILLHLGHKSAALLPTDARGRAEATEWLFAALNSVEMASVPWSCALDTAPSKRGVAFRHDCWRFFSRSMNR